MKHLTCLLLLAAFPLLTVAQNQKKEIGNLVADDIPEIPERIKEKLEQYHNIRSASFADWAPGGNGIFISTRFGDVAQLHHVAGAGAARQQLTFFKEPINDIETCPDPAKKGGLFLKDVGGNENFQIYYYDMNTSEYKLLTDGKSRNMSVEWSKKGDRFAFISNKRNSNDMDIYISNAHDPSKEKMALQVEGGGWSIQDWSPDDKQLLIVNSKSINESYLYLLDPATSQKTAINPSEKQIAYRSARFSKDGKGIFFISDEDSEFANLRYYDLASKTIKNLSAAINWDVDGLALNEQGTSLAFTSNEGGYSHLYLLDTKTMKYTAVSNLPKGVYGGLKFNRKDSKQLAFTMNYALNPSDVYVYNTESMKLSQWTKSETGGLNPSIFIEPQLVHYPTFDSVNGKTRMIPALLYLPKNVTGKVAVVINIHGGPESQSLPTFNPTTQYLVSDLKTAVLVPNVRGSAGYGKNYLKLDNGFLRENSVKDIGKLLDWIALQPNLDAAKVAVWGGSYGGYMVLACMTHFNDRLKAGVDLFGICNFITFLEKTSGYRRDLRRVEYGDEREPKMREFLIQASPVNNVSKITKPMFIYQGANDPRVPQLESEQMVETLKKKGNGVWYLLAKDEGHSLAKKVNRDFFNAAFVFFLENHLMN